MSTSPQINPNDQEIDLGQLSKKIGSIVQSFIDWLFDGLLFVIKNKFIIGGLFVLGVGLGLYLDKTKKVYDHQIIVSPNFGSADYLYSKVELLNAKIKEGDTLFLKQIGVKNPKEIYGFKIEPIIDVYPFVNNNERNFELLKLMAEAGDIKKIIEEKTTSKNYSAHLISFSTGKKATEAGTLQPILNFLNQSDYFQRVQKVYVDNIQQKIKENDSIISQINGILNEFSKNTSSNSKNDKLIYYNENTQLNDIIKTKDELVKQQGNQRMDLVNLDEIVKENSHVLNIENHKSINGKMKLILPVLFVGLFVGFGILRGFYRRQLAKRNLA
ncbi:hypothetical protein LZZ90_02500 [Flavobacterium sp. SM15]|uniref:hypothetical protein n=1 Tax=Flavobacterium sp. SM15 TaxID=2908005 RepID=UPI001EDB0D6E|nr:hypothetical protein [Flavobacterium sp. SM15]MCG2610376.1 hypothetical protein [Flavobacterium sp. SM15]